MDQSLHDEIDRLKAVIEEQSETLTRQETLINRQISELEERVLLSETIDAQNQRIRELHKMMKPWNIWKWWLRRLFAGKRESGE